ncbi:hypothetical protein AMAG_05080 [Allomyces macrogynus ATCC 38327]|uniref:Uncharacterized protein n=1 Tax=Allomyces macrogynus (strain ATCC 38327) TaxID=578462 RepID=A0A0L0S769_ALLM3|nr:hypothetical protein AMAG_05080 [Allomyces macrogynus ATCC 38327]|eukprot:KNE58270.1 hypothetical protein AMAG_05080 [Allomyces macrogynus ATCC 38327]
MAAVAALPACSSPAAAKRDVLDDEDLDEIDDLVRNIGNSAKAKNAPTTATRAALSASPPPPITLPNAETRAAPPPASSPSPTTSLISNDMDAPPLSPTARPLRRVPSRRKSFPDMRRRHRKSSSTGVAAVSAVSTAVAPSLAATAGGPSTAAGTATASGVKTPVGAAGARSVLPLLVSSPTATATGAKSGLVGAPRTPPPPRILVTAPDLVAADDDHHHATALSTAPGAGTTRLRRSRSTSAGHAYTTISLVVRADPPTPRVVDELDLAIAEDPVDAVPPTPTKDASAAGGTVAAADKDDVRHHGHHRTDRLSASAASLPPGAALAVANGATAAPARVMPPSALKRDSAKDLSVAAPSIPVIAHSYHGDDDDDNDEPYQSPAVFLQSSSGWDTCFDWCQAVDNDVPGTVLIAPAATPPPGLCIGGSSRSSTAPPSPTTSATSSTLDIPVSAELGPPLPRTASTTSLTDPPSPFRSTPGSPLPGKSPRASTARAVRFSPAPPQVFATYAADEAAAMRQSVPQARLLYPDMHDLLAFQVLMRRQHAFAHGANKLPGLKTDHAVCGCGHLDADCSGVGKMAVPTLEELEGPVKRRVVTVFCGAEEA